MSSDDRVPETRMAGSKSGMTKAEIRARMTSREEVILATDEADRFESAIAAAEAEFAERAAGPVRVNFRWDAAPLAVVREAAELAGVPYQNYIKQVLYSHAVADVRAARAVDPRKSRA